MSVIDHQSDYVRDLLQRTDAVMTELGELALNSLRPDLLNTVVLRTCALVSQAQGVQASAIQAAEAAGMSAAFGNRILTTHLAKHTNQPTRALGSARALAVWLNEFPEFHQAMIDGTLSRSHLNELKDIDTHTVHHLLVRDQHMFIEAAELLVWTDFVGVVAYWLNAANPDGELNDPTDPKYGMRVRTKANGDVVISIRLDPVTGEAFLTMHENEIGKLERAERERLNEDPNAPVTSQRQKNLDALLRLMCRGWRREDGSYPDFLVNIVMSETVAEDLLARTYGHVDPRGDNPLDIDPFELPIDWGEVDGRCETIRGTPVHPKHALGVLLAGRLRRMIFDAEDHVVNESNDVRLFNERQRNTLLVQQRGQCAMGTQTPFRWLQADHIKPHSRGGLTVHENGQMIWGAENQAKSNSWDESDEGQ